MAKEVSKKDISVFMPPAEESKRLEAFDVLLHHMWPLLQGYWKESRPPGFPEEFELNWAALVEKIVRGDMVIVQAVSAGRLVGFMIGDVRQGIMCRDAIGYIQSAYIKPEFRDTRSIVLMGMRLRKELLRAGARHIFWDRMVSRDPYLAHQTLVTVIQRDD